MKNSPAAILFSVALASVVAFGALQFTAGCHLPAPLPPAPDASDAGWYGDASPTDTCEAAEARVSVLACRCADGVPVATKPGVFTDACRRAAHDGRNWRADCIARLTSCDRLEKSYRAIGTCP
jgi:hypothetical protein